MLDTKLQILILSEEFPPKSGGIAQWTNGIARGLTRNHCEVTVITRYDEDFPPDQEVDPGFEVRYIKKPPIKFLRHFHWKEALKEYFREKKGRFNPGHNLDCLARHCKYCPASGSARAYRCTRR